MNIVYVIKDAEDKLLEICDSIGNAFAWVYSEYEGNCKVEKYNENFRVIFEDETVEIIKWNVFS